MAPDPSPPCGRIARGKTPLPEDRFRKEIEEILEGEERRGGGALKGPSRRRTRSGPPGGFNLHLTPERLMLSGAGALVLGLIARPLFAPLAIAALVLFGLGYVLYLRRRRCGPAAKAAPNVRPSWRGQPVRREGNIIEFRDSWSSRLRRWFRQR